MISIGTKNIGHLKEVIEALPDDMLVIIQNGGSSAGSWLAACYDDAIGVTDDDGAVRIYPDDWTAEDAGMEEKDWENVLALPRSFVLASDLVR